MSGFWSGRIALPRQWPQTTARSAAFLLLLTMTAGPTGATAQTVGPDEIVNDGRTTQLALTDAQKMAIYKAVLSDHVRRTAGSIGAIPATVGAPVSPAAELAPLPDQAARHADAGLNLDLKYAMVEGDVVVVDPVGMRVIDVIHGSAIP